MYRKLQMTITCLFEELYVLFICTLSRLALLTLLHLIAQIFELVADCLTRVAHGAARQVCSIVNALGVLQSEHDQQSEDNQNLSTNTNLPK